MESRTFLLVHGAWHGGWCWARVRDGLQRLGHSVFTPTLTGLGERAHLASPAIDLDTHVTDIANVIHYEGLNEIVLVGHSYGGFVISGVTERAEAAVASLVFLDAFVPEDGESMAAVAPPLTREAIQTAVSRGESAVPPRPAELFRVNEADRAWVDRLCRPQPLGTLRQPLRLTGARERIARKTYIRASDYPNPVFDAAVEKLKALPGWRIEYVPCGHDVMVDMPERLAELILQAAQLDHRS